ncbi:hypothetical protein GOBAR_AA28080 [Gossypium barbadense]|uniref:Serine/threonine-protein phosphatase 4 regulatory subunit 3-like central domain-containing protein n=1 Tax=Gossypium barbadense TaxID=3634 RepID=A0A2P5WNC1_GOSBA|nr:hypothetical protein GOBAR_AA28080 [Gossypium barbadense]
MLFDGAPTALVSLIGQKQYRRCARDIYFFTQSTIYVKQLAYAILELVIISVFPELRDLVVDLHGKKHIKTVTESGIADQMRLTELILNDQDFFQKLMELFRICEDLENMDGLHMIFKIVKGIILFNSAQIFEKIFGDELIMDIIGSLEYDPDVPQVQHYRNFLKEHVVFKECCLPGFFFIEGDSTFIQELFARLRSPATSAESKKNLEKPTTLDCSPRTICRRHIMAGSYLYKCIWKALQQ